MIFPHFCTKNISGSPVRASEVRISEDVLYYYYYYYYYTKIYCIVAQDMPNKLDNQMISLQSN